MGTEPSHDLDPGGTGSLPLLPQGMVWHQFPPDPSWLEDPIWYDSLGRDLIDQRGIFALDPAEQVSQIEQLIDEHPTRGTEILFKAAAKGKDAVVRALLDRGVAPLDDDDLTLAPLHAAAYQGHLGCVEVLLQAGMDVNQREDTNRTPLMSASAGGHVDITRYLLGYGADPTLTQNTEYGDLTAIDFWAGKGNIEFVQELLDWSNSSADGGVRNSNVRTAVSVTPVTLAAGASSGSEDMVRLLLERGGYPTDSDYIDNWKGDRLTPAQKQAICGAILKATAKYSVLKLLLGYLSPQDTEGNFLRPGFDPETRGAVADALVHEPITRGSLELLLDFGFFVPPADPDEDLLVDRYRVVNRNLCDAAAGHGLDIIALLLNKYGDTADVNCRPAPHNITPLYRAAVAGDTDVINTLVRDYGADIHVGAGRYINGPTALFIAIWRGHTDVVRLLLELGGPVEHVDESITTDSKKIIVTAEKWYRSPVRVLPGDDPSMTIPADGNITRMELEYPDRVPWLSTVQIRREDAGLSIADGDLKQQP